MIGSQMRLSLLVLIGLILSLQVPVLALGIPDIEILSFETAPSAMQGGTEYIEYSFVNSGNYTSGPLKLMCYLSADDTLSSSDIVIAVQAIRSVKPGDVISAYTSKSIPKSLSLGIYYPILKIVPTQDALADGDLENNVFIASQIEITDQPNVPREWVNKKISEILFIKTNEERELRNRPPLVYNEMLESISQGHTDDMADRDYFDHLTPEGKNPHDRAREKGYPYVRVREDGTILHGIGENIARFPTGKTVYVEGFAYIDPNDPIQLADVAITLFLNSASHKEALLDKIYEEIGISATLARDGQYYIGQNFG